MRKFSKILLLPFLAAVSSCSPSNLEKVAITFGREYDATLVSDTYAVVPHLDEVTRGGLQSLVTDERNFVLVVYDRESTCTCWARFSESLNNYMQNKDAMVYGIQYSLLDDGGSTFGLTIASGENTLAVFQNGAVKYQYTTKSDNDPLWDPATLADWLDLRVTWSNMNYVSLSQVDALFKGGVEFTLAFMRSTCGDCSYVERHLLKERASTPLLNTIYLLDCDVPSIRYNDNGEVDAEAWQAFKDKYGLSVSGNATYGYDLGVVPTFVRYLPTTSSNYSSCVKDMAVYFNDSVSKNDDGTYKVSNSYYDGMHYHEFLDGVTFENVILGKTLTEDQIDTYTSGETTYYSWKHESAALSHDPILNQFLDFYGGLLK